MSPSFANEVAPRSRNKTTKIRYAEFPRCVQTDGKLKPGARVLYAALCMRAIHKPEVTVGYAWLASDIGWRDIGTVGKWMRTLRDRGLVEIEPPRNGSPSVIKLLPLDNVYEDNTQPFVMLPWAIIRDYELPVPARLLYGALIKYAWSTGRMWASQKTIADDLGWNVRSVSRYMGCLKTRGLISIMPRFKMTAITTLVPLIEVYSKRFLLMDLNVWREPRLYRLDWRASGGSSAVDRH